MGVDDFGTRKKHTIQDRSEVLHPSQTFGVYLSVGAERFQHLVSKAGKDFGMVSKHRYRERC